MKIVSLDEKFCSVRILHCLQNVTLPYMSHIIGVLNCRLSNKAYCKTVKRLIGCPQSVGKILLLSILQMV